MLLHHIHRTQLMWAGPPGGFWKDLLSAGLVVLLWTEETVGRDVWYHRRRRMDGCAVKVSEEVSEEVTFSSPGPPSCGPPQIKLR